MGVTGGCLRLVVHAEIYQAALTGMFPGGVLANSSVYVSYHGSEPMQRHFLQNRTSAEPEHSQIELLGRLKHLLDLFEPMNVPLVHQTSLCPALDPPISIQRFGTVMVLFQRHIQQHTPVFSRMGGFEIDEQRPKGGDVYLLILRPINKEKYRLG